MADNLQKRGGQDRNRINVNQDHELRDWAEKFDASRQQIKEAVQAVGDRADDVEQYLKGSHSTMTSERMAASMGSGERKPAKRVTAKRPSEKR